MKIEETWLPKCLSHLNELYIAKTDESIVIGELSSAAVNGYVGLRQVYTALVPLSRLDEVLSTSGGIGWKVESWGPRPVVDEDYPYKSDFWIQGQKGRDDRLEPLVVGWEHHNKTVMMPDNGLLMCYGLCPRVQKDPERIIWDNLGRPEYDVVSVKPLSHYEMPSKHSGCEVKIDRRYLEDYACLKGCAVVSVFYEERRCEIDEELDEILEGKKGDAFKFPGRDIQIIHNNYDKTKPILCKIWGCRLVLVPTGRPISDEKDPELEWPGHSGIITHDRAMASGINDYAYVSDQVLELFEGKPEYDIYPLSGGVSYDGWWSLSYSDRISRDYIAYELKKIYEGCPPNIIQHVHRYAVVKEVADAQRNALGDMNIGTRAESLVNAFLDMGEALATLGDCLGFALQDEDITSLSRETVNYHGWWTRDNLMPLGYRAALDMKKSSFLERCKAVYLLIEGIKEKPLRRMIKQIGLQDKQVDSFKSLKLLATLLQLCEISVHSGITISTKGTIADRWDMGARIEALRPLFALVDLRNAAGHDLGTKEPEKVAAALNVFEIQEGSMTTGWGLATDKIYDQMIDSLNALTALLKECAENQ